MAEMTRCLYNNVEVDFEDEEQIEEEPVEQTDDGCVEVTLEEQVSFYKQKLRLNRLAQSKILKDGYKAPVSLPKIDNTTHAGLVACYKHRLQNHLKATQRRIKGRQGGNVDFCPNRNTMFKRCQLNIQNLKKKVQEEASVRSASM